MIRRLNEAADNYGTNLDQLVDVLKELCKYSKSLDSECSREDTLYRRMWDLDNLPNSPQDVGKVVSRLTDKQAKLNGFPSINDNEVSAGRCLKLADELLDRVAFLVGDMKKQNHTMEDVIQDCEEQWQ